MMVMRKWVRFQEYQAGPMAKGQKRIIVTGAASGLGRAIALHFARRQWQVVVADIQHQAGREVVGEIEALGARGWYQACDVAHLSDLEQLAEFTDQTLGGADVLVNNAGVGSAGTLMEASEAEWDRLLQINLMSCVRASRCFIPMMSAAGSGHIVNVASFAALALAPGMMTYNVAKAGVLAFSESLRGELIDLGIGVTVVCPSFFKTNLLGSVQQADPEALQQVERLMQRSAVTAEHVAADLFRAVADNRFMLIPHSEARHFDRLLRWFPKLAFRLKLTQMRRLRARLGEQST
jgi:NAD(P)-dependent dehydrogenase (short-subunit alcohol dehydrogenase family)